MLAGEPVHREVVRQRGKQREKEYGVALAGGGLKGGSLVSWINMTLGDRDRREPRTERRGGSR